MNIIDQHPKQIPTSTYSYEKAVLGTIILIAVEVILLCTFFYFCYQSLNKFDSPTYYILITFISFIIALINLLFVMPFCIEDWFYEVTKVYRLRRVLSLGNNKLYREAWVIEKLILHVKDESKNYWEVKFSSFDKNLATEAFARVKKGLPPVDPEDVVKERNSSDNSGISTAIMAASVATITSSSFRR